MSDTSKTVDHAARLLAAVRTAGTASTTELARRLELSRTVTTRLVATLAAHDLLRRTAEGVSLGFGLLDLAAGLGYGIREAARPYLEELAAQFHETAVLTLAADDAAIAVDQVLPDRRVMRVHYQSGSRHSLMEAAHGRAMLAHLPQTVEQLVAGRKDRGRLLAELDEVRRRGYALSHDELEHGVTGLAAPVFDAHSEAVASIGLVAPSARFPGVPEVAGAVRRAADRVSITITRRLAVPGSGGATSPPRDTI
jgi:IclR family KDG regulon transcriptional repressor